MLAVGIGLLAVGIGLFGCWLLEFGFWLLVVGVWLLADYLSTLLTLGFCLLRESFALGCGVVLLPLMFWRWAVGARLAFGFGRFGQRSRTTEEQNVQSLFLSCILCREPFCERLSVKYVDVMFLSFALSFSRWVAVLGLCCCAFGVGPLPLSYWRLAFGGRLAFGFGCFGQRGRGAEKHVRGRGAVGRTAQPPLRCETGPDYVARPETA